MTAQPKRRWFRFGLRTMFVVVTIFGVWLGWELSIVRERKAIIAEVYRFHEKSPPFLRLYGGLESIEADDPQELVDFFGLPRNYEYIRVSPVRRLLGDESCVTLFLDPSHGPEYIERAERAFPEAVLFSISSSRPRTKEYRDSLYAPPAIRKPNEGIIFKTGLIEK